MAGSRIERGEGDLQARGGSHSPTYYGDLKLGRALPPGSDDVDVWQMMRQAEDAAGNTSEHRRKAPHRPGVPLRPPPTRSMVKVAETSAAAGIPPVTMEAEALD